MIDPITALSVAASAVSNAKQLLAAGKDATSALSRFAGAVSDVNYAAELGLVLYAIGRNEGKW